VHPQVTSKRLFLWAFFLRQFSSIRCAPAALSLFEDRWVNTETGGERREEGRREGGVEVPDTGRWFPEREGGHIQSSSSPICMT